MFRGIRRNIEAFIQFIIDLGATQKNITEFKKTVNTQDIQDLLQVKINDEVFINIICEVTTYDYKINDGKYKNLVMFNVSSEYPESLPNEIKSLFDFKLSVPKLINNRAALILHSRIAIEAYLSLIHSNAAKSLSHEIKKQLMINT